jgi:hypothetical protein
MVSSLQLLIKITEIKRPNYLLEKTGNPPKRDFFLLNEKEYI